MYVADCKTPSKLAKEDEGGYHVILVSVVKSFCRDDRGSVRMIDESGRIVEAGCVVGPPLFYGSGSHMIVTCALQSRTNMASPRWDV